MGGERPLGNEGDSLGGNATAPIRRTEPIPDLGASSIDVGHAFESNAAGGIPVNDDCQRAWRVNRRNATDIGLGIGEMIWMGEEVAEPQPDATVVGCQGDRRRIGGDERPDKATPPDELNAHIVGLASTWLLLGQQLHAMFAPTMDSRRAFDWDSLSLPLIRQACLAQAAGELVGIIGILKW